MSEAIKQVLLDDQTSRTQQDVIDVNEQLGDMVYQFPSADAVPRHLYQSLSFLLTGADDQDFSSVIKVNIGRHQEEFNHGVELVYASEESGEVSDAADEDDIGTEFALLSVLCRGTKPKVGVTYDAALVKAIDLRIRYLIDYKIREVRGYADHTITPDIPPSDDPTINPDFSISCHWLKYLTLENTIEKSALYRLDYKRIFVA